MSSLRVFGLGGRQVWGVIRVSACPFLCFSDPRPPPPLACGGAATPPPHLCVGANAHTHLPTGASGAPSGPTCGPQNRNQGGTSQVGPNIEIKVAGRRWDRIYQGAGPNGNQGGGSQVELNLEIKVGGCR